MSGKALILIGLQNDYFAEDGILKEVVEESSKVSNIINNIITLVDKLEDTLIISTPIIFSEDYSELIDPVGILQTIKEVGAFKKGTKGAETINEIKAFEDKIIEIPGKLGLNAFINTKLEETLKIQLHLCLQKDQLLNQDKFQLSFQIKNKKQVKKHRIYSFLLILNN